MPISLTLYAAVGLSALLAALLVYRYDLYNREPWYMIALAVGLGAGTMRLVGELELWSLGYVASPVGQAAVAAFHEESARLAAVVAIALLFPAQFDDPMDGIVYGSMIGLGMAVEESFHVLFSGSGSAPASYPIEVVRLLGHLVMGGIAGFGVGLGRVRIAGWRRGLIISFAVALALHFSWDWVALAPAEGGPSTLRSLLAAGILVSGMLFYGMQVMLGSRLSKEIFEPGSARGLWGFPFKAR